MSHSYCVQAKILRGHYRIDDSHIGHTNPINGFQKDIEHCVVPKGKAFNSAVRANNDVVGANINIATDKKVTVVEEIESEVALWASSIISSGPTTSEPDEIEHC